MVKLALSFWESLEKRYPAAINDYYRWLHQYKESVGWNHLFKEKTSYVDLPIALQIGIFFQYASERRGLTMGRIADLKDFYQISKVIEAYLAAVPDSTDDFVSGVTRPGMLGSMTKLILPDISDDPVGGGSFNGGGGEFGGGGASGDWKE